MLSVTKVSTVVRVLARLILIPVLRAGYDECRAPPALRDHIGCVGGSAAVPAR